MRSSRQQFSRIRCRAGLGSTNWKPCRNAFLSRTVARTFTCPIRNMRFNSTTSVIGSSRGKEAESPRSLISSVLPKTEPIERELIVTSTHSLNLKSRRASRRLSIFGILSGLFSTLSVGFDMGLPPTRIAQAPSITANTIVRCRESGIAAEKTSEGSLATSISASECPRSTFQGFTYATVAEMSSRLPEIPAFWGPKLVTLAQKCDSHCEPRATFPTGSGQSDWGAGQHQ
jgi:hypothetical protein